MGGIGPVELADIDKLVKLREQNGVIFYAGRFYPKGNKEIIEDLFDDTIPLWQNNSPPWLTWKDMDPTQIWMMPLRTFFSGVSVDERIINMDVRIERIDIWPDAEGEQTLANLTKRDERSIQSGWGTVSSVVDFNPDPNLSEGSIDPGLTVSNASILNIVPSTVWDAALVASLGYLGVATISGYVSEYGFYDQELHIINGTQFGQPQYFNQFLEGMDPNKYKEYVRIRNDGVWIKKTDDDAEQYIRFDDDDDEGYPKDKGFINEQWKSAYYSEWIIDSDKTIAAGIGNKLWDRLFTDFGPKYIDAATKEEITFPNAGAIVAYKPTKFRTLVYTIKVSCDTIYIPPQEILDNPVPIDSEEGLIRLAEYGLNTLASNLSSNIWYFYMPVKYNHDLVSSRTDYLFNVAGINKLTDPLYMPKPAEDFVDLSVLDDDNEESYGE